MERDSYSDFELCEKIAKELNIKVVAEYIHSENVFEAVKSLGIELYQGYLFSEPNLQ